MVSGHNGNENMSVEHSILVYLAIYGNTRESDLIDYGSRSLDQSSGSMKRTIDRMIVEGKMFRILHKKLRKPVAYLASKSLPTEVMLRAEAESMGIEKKDVNEVVGKALRILEEAALIAEGNVEKEFRIESADAVKRLPQSGNQQ